MLPLATSRARWLKSTPPPQTEPAEEKDPKRVAHEKLAKEVTMPADIKTARHKEIWHLALSWEFSNIRTPETNKKLKLADSREIAVWHEARKFLKRKRLTLKKRGERAAKEGQRAAKDKKQKVQNACHGLVHMHAVIYEDVVQLHTYRYDQYHPLELAAHGPSEDAESLHKQSECTLNIDPAP